MLLFNADYALTIGHLEYSAPKADKVMNIFRDAGVKTFQWTPVAIEG